MARPPAGKRSRPAAKLKVWPFFDGSAEDAFRTTRSLPHGHVEAVLKMARKLELDKLIAAKRCPERDLVMAMIVQRVIFPCSKLAATRDWHTTTLAEGRPVAVEVYPGNTGDPTTVLDQVEKLRVRFGLLRVVLVGDRGMLRHPLPQHPRAGVRPFAQLSTSHRNESSPSRSVQTPGAVARTQPQ